MLDISLFDEKTCDKRWTSSYYKATQRNFSSLSSCTPSIEVSIFDSTKRRRLTQHEKFRKASILTTELAAVVSEASHTHFYRRLELLQELMDHWKSGDEVALADVDDGMKN